MAIATSTKTLCSAAAIGVVVLFSACAGEESLGSAGNPVPDSGTGKPDTGGIGDSGTPTECSDLEEACGSSCCSSAEVCLFEQCVVPGKLCRAAADCDEGEYCETALGDSSDGGAGGAGSVDAGSTACTQPLPANGRCIPLPPVCDENGQGPDGGTCFDKCEYHPPAGRLDAVVKWQWGQAKVAKEHPQEIDVWATPAVGRIVDANCDGKVDDADPPNIVFVSSNVKQTCCSCSGDAVSTCRNGKLRVLDGRTGDEIWTLATAKANSPGFAGLSVALGDMTGDGKTDIVAMTGDGYIAVIDAGGNVIGVSDKPVDTATAETFGWGGGISLGDADGDGTPEIAFGRSLFEINGSVITRQWVGSGGNGGASGPLSFFVDLTGDGRLELLAGNTAYLADGSVLWTASAGGNGFNAVADLDADGEPEVVLVHSGSVYVLDGATGTVELGPTSPPGASGSGGPPTVADFDGDGRPEIGVAFQTIYAMLKPSYAAGTLDTAWTAPNHDLSSSVTGSSVFDFDGNGEAEVVYNDECFIWVYDGKTGAVLFASPTTSFTATEASIVADVDGDGRAEIVMVSNGIATGSGGWKCNIAPWNAPDPANNRPAWVPPAGATAYRGITVWGDKENSWVGTRTIWNQHGYSVSNVCDSRDSACAPPNVYGSIPRQQKPNWSLPWLNNFRQNVQDKGLFDAPDATVAIAVDCVPLVVHVSVRNVGLASLPAGVVVGIFVQLAPEKQLGTVTTTKALAPGQTEVFDFPVPSGSAGGSDGFFARIIVDPQNKKFNECREDNNESAKVTPLCAH